MFDAYSVNTLKLETEKCNGCGNCIEVCPHAVFDIRDRRAVLAYAERCMECGACMRNCPAGAIFVESGVGCAAAMISAALHGKPTDEGACGCN